MKPITEQDYQEAALELGCKVAAIKAVAITESSGSGFLPTGELVILFEPHIFWRQLKKYGQDPAAILKAHPDAADVLYEHFKGHVGERPSQQWDRLRKAGNLPYGPTMRAAYEATSFGEFQIMGFNAEAAGYQSVFEFVHYLQQGEVYHLKAFVSLIKAFDLAKYLAREDWTGFARQYNGPGFRGNPNTILDDYDYKIGRNFKTLAA